MPPFIGPIIFGDTSEDLADHAHGDADVLTVDSSEYPVLYLAAVGDARSLLDHAIGGNDTVTVSGFLAGEAVGDALLITDHARGGDDVVVSLLSRAGLALGDAETIAGHGSGGNDQCAGSLVYGDAFTITDQGQGGDDTIAIQEIDQGAVGYGDAGTMSGHSRGGDDLLSAANAGYGQVLYGDAQTLTGLAHGGDDTLVAPLAPSFFGPTTSMFGDGSTLADHARGGDDVLISGHGDDVMWGDAAVVGPRATTGADRFVFAQQNGHDQIMDFQLGKDHIELDGFGFSGFEELAANFQTTSEGVLISFDADADILVRNVSVNQLHSADFILT
ncbi:hypothetical protein LJR225_005083 [Phenylobacterium sp. LjRoot225]|uniref:M10 family metallopeptidase C-terminal domain-containing protein n=1 Tax=Phenylobacterium sp. LjRoot225 TaxID=3342285 RepID=UPI003ECE6D30